MVIRYRRFALWQFNWNPSPSVKSGEYQRFIYLACHMDNNKLHILHYESYDVDLSFIVKWEVIWSLKRKSNTCNEM